MFINSKHKKTLSILIGTLSAHFCYSQTWSPVGSGTNQVVYAFEKYNNALYAGGSFDLAGGIYSLGIARWDCVKWDSVKSGVNGPPYAFAVYNNELYAGGDFLYVNGIANTFKIARWDGSAWYSAGNNNSGSNTQNIKAMAVYNNQLYAAGNITTIGGLNVNRIAKWNGSNWSSVGGGVTGGFGDISAMAVYKGQLYVGGDFGYAGGKQTNYIARWNGTVWDSVGMGLDYYVTSMVVDSIANVLYVSGGFGHAGNMNTLAIGVAKWDGTTWSAVGSDTLNSTRVLEMYHNELYAGGGNVMVAINGEQINNIYRWDGSQWHSVGGGTNGEVTSLKVYKDNLYVGGEFTQAGTISANHIAKWYSPDDTAVNEKKNEVEYLGNNIPNPFNNSTQIPYFVPTGSTGILNVVDMRGELVKSYSLTEGHNQLEILLNEYSRSVYFYSLSIDEGRIVRNKKMVLDK